MKNGMGHWRCDPVRESSDGVRLLEMSYGIHMIELKKDAELKNGALEMKDLKVIAEERIQSEIYCNDELI